jgi:heme-degrading monooxygenase HmoA
VFARVTRIQGTPDHIDETVKRIEESTPQVQQLAGLQRAMLLVDRQAGEALTVTFWDTREHMEAARPAARQILVGVAGSLGGGLSEPRVYEVASDVGPASP